MKLVVLSGSDDEAPGGAAPNDPAATGRHGAVALSDSGRHWALLNVAPNVADRLRDDAALSCHAGLRDADVRTVVLTDAQVDHLSGLLSLRNGAPIDLYATPAVFEVLSQHVPVLGILQHYCGVHWHVIPVAGETASASFRVESLPGLEFTALATDGPMPRYLDKHTATGASGLSIALAVRDTQTGQRLFCAPGAQRLGEPQLDWMRSADCIVLDGLATWPVLASAAESGWRAQRKVRMGAKALSGAATGISHDGFERAYDGMVIEF